MSPLKSTFQFMCLAMVLGTILAVTDRAILRAPQPNQAQAFKEGGEPLPPDPALIAIASAKAATITREQPQPVAETARDTTQLRTVLAAANSAFRLQPIATSGQARTYRRDTAYRNDSVQSYRRPSNWGPTSLTAPLRSSILQQTRRVQTAAPQSTWSDPDNAPKQRQSANNTSGAINKLTKFLRFLPKPRKRPTAAAAAPPVVLASNAINSSANVVTLNQAGYAALNAGQNAFALRQFETSLSLDPNQPLILAQTGYLYKAAGRFNDAAQSFQRIPPSAGLQPGIARESSYLSRPLRLNAYTVWREDSRPEADISFGPSLAQSQSGIAVTYRLPVDGWASRHDVAVYSRVLWGYEPSSLSLNTDSFQGGVGVQMRPFADLNLVAAAERLISLGDQSRDDWLLRTSYSAGQGYAPVNAERSWLHWSLYADAAVIDPSDPDIQLIAESRIGFGQRPFDSAAFSVIPFAGAFANYQDAAGQTTRLFEAGAGLWMRYWPGGRDLPDPMRALDLRLEYRGKVGGDSASTSGVRVTLDMTY